MIKKIIEDYDYKELYGDYEEERETTVSNDNVMKVIMVEPGKKAYITTMGTELEDMQKAVDGYIECVPYKEIGGRQICLVCNEEGKINGMLPNRPLYDVFEEVCDIVFGPFFVCQETEDSFCSIDDDIIDELLQVFLNPVRISVINGKFVVEEI